MFFFVLLQQCRHLIKINVHFREKAYILPNHKEVEFSKEYVHLLAGSTAKTKTTFYASVQSL